MRKTLAAAGGAALLLIFGANVRAQTAAYLQSPSGQAGKAQPAGAGAGGQQGAPVALTLKSAIEMALRNSKDIQIAKLQASLATARVPGEQSGIFAEFVRGVGSGLHVRNS